MPKDPDPRQELYEALSALETRSRKASSAYSRRQLAGRVAAKHGVNLGEGGQRIAEWMHPDPGARKVPDKDHDLWALVDVLFDYSGTRPTAQDRTYWLRMVTDARSTPRAAPLVAQGRIDRAVGHPLETLRDPFAWQIHQVISPAMQGRGGADLPTLPMYVRRAHDDQLDRTLDEILVENFTGARMVVLIGESSTGKSRALWEAVQRLRERAPGWRLWRPRPEDLNKLLRSRGADGGVGSKTVLWLNELQGFLYHDGTEEALGIAAGLQELISSTDRGPILVMGTLWPRHLEALTAQPPGLGPDAHAAARALLPGCSIRIPDSFVAESVDLFQAAAKDPRWDEALQQSQGRPTQYLAGGYELVRRYVDGGATLHAVLHAAGDARRLGHRQPFAIELLRSAAEGYLDNDDWKLLPPEDRNTWFEKALEALDKPCRGTPGPLTPSRAASGQTPMRRLELADYLEHHLSRTRQLSPPPASFWDSFRDRAEDLSIDDLERLGHAAYSCGYWRHAFRLYVTSIERGDRTAGWHITELLLMADRVADAIPWYRWAANADPGGLPMAKVSFLLERAGRPDEVILQYQRLATTTIDDGHAVQRVTRLLVQTGREAEAISWLKQRAAAGSDTARSELIALWLRNGSVEVAITWLLQLADGGDEQALYKAFWLLREAGRIDEALKCRQPAASDGDELARHHVVALLEMTGRDDEALACMQKYAEADDGIDIAWTRRATDRLIRTDRAGPALDWLRSLAEVRGPTAVKELASTLARLGRLDELLTWSQHPDLAGDDETGWDVARTLLSAGRLDAAVAYAQSIVRTESATTMAAFLRRAGLIDEAAEWYGRACGLGSTRALLSAAKMFQDEQRHDYAAAWFERAADSGDSDLLWAAVDGLLKLGRVDAALSRCEIEAADDDAALWRTASSLWSAGLVDEALSWSERAAEGGGADLLRATARHLQRAGRPDQALAWYQRAAEMGDISALREAGPLLENDDGLAWLQRAAETGQHAALFRASSLLKREGRTDELLSWLGELSEGGFDPDFTAATFMEAAWTHTLSGRDDEAIALYRRAADLGDSTALNRAASLLEQADRTTEALDLLASSADRGDAAARWQIAELLSRLGRIDEAIPRYQDAAMNGAMLALSGIASMLQEEGRLSEALAWYHRAAEHGELYALPAAVELLRHLGRYHDAQKLQTFGHEPGGTISTDWRAEIPPILIGTTQP